MRRFWALLVLLLISPALFAGELTILGTPANRSVTGDLISINDKQCVFKGPEGPLTTPLPEVVGIKLADEPPAVNVPYTQVVLTDGSILQCKPDGVLFAQKQVKLQLLAGYEIQVPLTAMSHILRNAHDPKVREHDDWKDLLKRRRSTDQLVRVAGARLNPLEAVVVGGEGNKVEFKYKGDIRPALLENLAGVLFANPGDLNRPITACRVVDSSRNSFVAALVESTEGGDFQVTLLSADPSSPKLTLPRDKVALIDFSKGRYDLLSDLKPDIEEEPGEDVLLRYRYFPDEEKEKRNRNLVGGRLRLGGKEYDRGMSLPAPTVLTYALKGDYKELTATVGIDDMLPGDSQVQLVIEGDDTKLFDAEISRASKTVPVRLDVKGIQKLRISVRSVSVLNLGNHLNLVDVKVSR